MRTKEYIFLAGFLVLGLTLCGLSVYQLLVAMPTSSTPTSPSQALYSPSPTVNAGGTDSFVNQSQDALIKSEVGQVATAAEACYTANNNSYANCLSVPTLVSQGYIRSQPANPIIISPTSSAATGIVVYGKMSAAAICQTGSGANKYYVYRSSTGTTSTECSSTTPSLTPPAL